MSEHDGKCREGAALQVKEQKAKEAIAEPKVELVTELEDIEAKIALFNSQLKFALKQAKESISRSLRMLGLPLQFRIDTMIGVDTKACSKEIADRIKAAFASKPDSDKKAKKPVEDEPEPSQDS